MTYDKIMSEVDRMITEKADTSTAFYFTHFGSLALGSNAMLTKICRRCGQELPATSEFFNKHSATKDRFQTYCRSCQREIRKQWEIDNPDRRRANIDRWNKSSKHHETVKAWKKKHPELTRLYAKKSNAKRRSINTAWQREKRRRNPEKHRLENAIWRKNNPEKANQWYKDNPEKAVIATQRRRARKKSAGGTYTRYHIQALYDFQEGRCFHCDADMSEGYHIDHWIPLNRGGSNWPENLRLLCPHCNLTKHDKMPWEWSEKYAKFI